MKTWTLRPGNGNAGPTLQDPKAYTSRWWILPTILVSGLAGYFIFRENQPVSVKTQIASYRSPVSTIESERKSPEDFVTGHVKMRRNFFNEIIIEGSLRNIATGTRYKDAVLRVEFLSKPGEVLLTKDYQVDGTLSPNAALAYKFKNQPLPEVDRIRGRILKADLFD